MKEDWHRSYDPGVPVTLEYPDLTLFGLFELAVRENPERTATLFFGSGIRYRQLGLLVKRLAAALAGLGVGPGDRVSLILPNLPAYPIAHFAALKLGAVLVPTNPLYVERELQHQLNDAGVETIIALDKLRPVISSVTPRTSVQRVIYTRVQDFLPFHLRLGYRIKNRHESSIELGESEYWFEDLLRMQWPEVPVHPSRAGDTAMLLYTGGTTGISKGAVLSHANLVANVMQTRAWLLGFRDAAETILAVLPFFHSYGLTTSLHLAVESRATLLLIPRFDLDEVVKRIKRHRPTIFCGVPSMYQAITRCPGLDPADVNSIRMCVSGGAALPDELQTRFEELTGGKLVEGYGLTETSPVAIVNPMFGHRKAGTIGLPISDTRARIADPETGRELPVGEIGELCIQGPQVMQGYWNRPDETRQVLRDGWLHTGDLGKRDEEGFFSIVDRKKDIIISAGMNIYPREVEEVLLTHPEIEEVAVVGVHSRVREETVKAFIVAKEGCQLSKTDVIDFCAGKLSRYKMPRQIEFRTELPKSAVGKILKRVLLEETAGK